MLSIRDRCFEKDGEPFFWLGDTCWLLFSRMTPEEQAFYLHTRALQGFTVVQATLYHEPDYHDREDRHALMDGDFARPDMESGYWNQVLKTVRLAAKEGLTMALVLCWGDFYKEGIITPESGEKYAAFVAGLLGKEENVIFLLGGDVRGSACPETFRRMGRTLKRLAPERPVGFHPFGRTSSSDWFAGEDWLDFHLFQSGHRDRNQRVLGAWDDNAVAEEEWMGEENYRYVLRDLKRDRKPVLDAEPSYEEIPHGLHDPAQPFWRAREVRRYAWWSCLAGAAGFTYGHNSVMQAWCGIGKPQFGVRRSWQEALAAEGAGQMRFLRETLEAADFSRGRSAQETLRDNDRPEDGYLLALETPDCLLVYSYLGNPIRIDPEKLSFRPERAWWLNPATGSLTPTLLSDRGVYAPPHGEGLGDAVLILSTGKAACRLENMIRK